MVPNSLLLQRHQEHWCRAQCLFRGVVEQHNVVEGSEGVVLRRARPTLEASVNVKHGHLHERWHEAVINEQIGSAGNSAQRTEHFEHTAANVQQRREYELLGCKNIEDCFTVLD